MRVAVYYVRLKLSHLLSRLLLLRPMEGHHRITGSDTYVAWMPNVLSRRSTLLSVCLWDTLPCKLLSFIL